MKPFFALTIHILLCIVVLGSQLITGVYAQDYLVNTQPQPELENQQPDIPSPDWNLDLTVSPVSINIETQPGEPVSSAVKVKNNGLGPEYLQIDLAKFTADETGARPQILDVEPGDEFVNWLSFSEDTFIVNPGEWKTIDVTFSPPVDAALGYYITLIFNRQKIVDPEARQTVVTGAPAILMLANVNSPNAKKEVNLVEFSVDKNIFEFLPAVFTVTVGNTGNVHLVPTGNIFIDRGNTKDIAILSINESGGNILADSERDYTVSWSDGFPVWEEKISEGSLVKDEDGNTVKKLQWDFGKADKLRIGKYTAHLLMVYDNGERDVPIEASVDFWIIPWRLILGAILIVVIPFVVGRVSGRRRK